MATQQMMLTAHNQFHGTTTSFRLTGTGVISAGVTSRVRRDLCGVDGCGCSTDLGVRRDEYTPALEDANGEVYGWECQYDGTTLVFASGRDWAGRPLDGSDFSSPVFLTAEDPGYESR